MDARGVLQRERGIEGNIGQQIDFVQDHQLCFAKNAGILQGFVFALGDAEHDNFGVLAQVVAGGANQVADVFDQQQVQRFTIVQPAGQLIFHHPRIQVAGTGGGNLSNGIAVASQTASIVVGLDVAGKNCGPYSCRRRFERLFEQHGLARTRRADQIKYQRVPGTECVTQPRRNLIVRA